MIIIEDMKSCYGCTACYNACNSSAIVMIENDEGFLNPAIDQELCIECGACKRVCPALGIHYSENEQPTIFAFSANYGEMLRTSSSGGAFSVIAQWFYDNGGVVFGAAFDENYSVRHVIAHNEEEGKALRMSKYVESNQGICYTKAKRLLDRGIHVLYCGCPCQIAGLRNYLGKEYDNLCTVDLLCHGVPSQRDFRDYLNEMWGIDNIIDIRMRKRDGWGTCFYVETNNGRIYEESSKIDLFLNAFLSNICLKHTCYQCSFAKLPRVGDLTIGDLWTVKQLGLGEEFKNKSSLVLANSNKGRRIWSLALASFHSGYSCNEIETSKIKLLNRNVFEPTVSNSKNRETYFNLRKSRGFCDAAKAVLFPYDVGLILFASDNYGSTATNTALYMAIQSMGYRPIVLDNLVAPSGVSASYFDGHLSLCSKVKKNLKYKHLNSLCETYVIGSDQSLRWDFGRVRKNFEYMLMAFTANDKRRIAYAVSFGPERYSIGEDLRFMYEYLLKRFNSLSVREDYAVDMCKRMFHCDADQVLDPVFLLDQRDYHRIAAESDVELPEHYLLAYIRYASPEKRKFIMDMSMRYDVETIVICDALSYERLKDELELDAIIIKPAFVDWLAYYANADYIITDSFHGTCFSLIFEKQFVAIKAGSTQRFDSLAAMICDTREQAKSVFLNSDNQLVGPADKLFQGIDYEMFNRNLNRHRDFSRQWLKEALEAEVKPRSMPNEDVLVRYTRILRRKNELAPYEARYAYNESMRSQEARLESVRGTFLAGRAAAEKVLYAEDIDLRTPSVSDFFKLTNSNNKYLVILACKDDCSKHWESFVSKAKIPTIQTPKMHNAYVAIVLGGRVLFEALHDDELRLGFKIAIDSSGIPHIYNQQTGRYIAEPSGEGNAVSDRQDLIAMNSAGGLIAIRIVSKRFDKKLHDERASIMIDNIDYAINRRGINIVVLDLESSLVVNSSFVDLRGDASLTLKQQ